MSKITDDFLSALEGQVKGKTEDAPVSHYEPTEEEKKRITAHQTIKEAELRVPRKTPYHIPSEIMGPALGNFPAPHPLVEYGLPIGVGLVHPPVGEATFAGIQAYRYGKPLAKAMLKINADEKAGLIDEKQAFQLRETVQKETIKSALPMVVTLIGIYGAQRALPLLLKIPGFKAAWESAGKVAGETVSAGAIKEEFSQWLKEFGEKPSQLMVEAIMKNKQPEIPTTMDIQKVIGAESLETYQREVLEEVNKIPLPQVESVPEWYPPTFAYQNPYTKSMNTLLKEGTEKAGEIPIIKHLIPSEGKPPVAMNLLRDRMRIEEGLYQRAKETYVDPLRKYSPELKQELGLMINKYIPVKEGYKGVVKEIDVEIGRYGKAISDLGDDWLAKGWILPEEKYLSNETFLNNLGKYSRSFYREEGQKGIFPSLRSQKGKISTSMFKRKMSLEDWGKTALSYEGKELREDVARKATERQARRTEILGMQLADLDEQIAYFNAELTRQQQIAYKGAITPRLSPVTQLRTQRRLGITGERERVAIRELERAQKERAHILQRIKLEGVKGEIAREEIAPEIVDMSKSELEALGLEAKKAFGWVNEADAMLDGTFKDLTTQYANMSWQDSVVKSPEIFSRTPKEGWVAVKDILPKGVERTRVLGPLNGGYIHPGLEGDLRAMTTTGKHPIMEMLGETLSWWKISKTAGSPGAMARNYMSGNFIQTDMAGAPVWDPKNTPTYVRSVYDYLKKGDIYKRWRDAGLYGADYFKVEIGDIAGAKSTADISAKIFEKSAKLKNYTSYYGAIDHFGRTYLAEWAYAKGATEAQAVRFANKWQLDYRIVPQILDKLRKEGVVGAIVPFASFYYLMAPRTLEVAITRPWTIAKYPVLFEAMNSYSRSVLGLTKEQAEAIKPKWMAERSDWSVLLPVKDDKGQPQWLDLSYSLPFGGSWYTGFIDIDDMASLARGGGPIQVMQNINNNYDPFMKKEIVNKYDSPNTQLKKRLGYFLMGMGPGVLRDIDRARSAFKGEKYGYPFKLSRSKAQALLRPFGLSVYSGGINEYLSKAKELESDIKNLQFETKMTLTDPNISERERKKEVDYYIAEIDKRAKLLGELRSAKPPLEYFEPFELPKEPQTKMPAVEAGSITDDFMKTLERIGREKRGGK
jgi:hypothetical protein